MTVMQTPEKRFNMSFAIGLTIVGLAIWVVGLLAVAKGFLLPDYAAMLRGSGGVLALVGLVWVAVASLRQLDALVNLLASFILSLPGMGLWLAGAWLGSLKPDSVHARFAADYGRPLREGGRDVVVICLIWLFLSIVKLIMTPTVKKAK